MVPFDLDFKYMGFHFTDMGYVIRSIVNSSRDNSFFVLLEGLSRITPVILRLHYFGFRRRHFGDTCSDGAMMTRQGDRTEGGVSGGSLLCLVCRH